MSGLYALAGVVLGATLSFFASVIGTLLVKRAETRQTARLALYNELLPATSAGKRLWKFTAESEFEAVRENLMRVAAASLLTGRREVEHVDRMGTTLRNAEQAFRNGSKKGESDADIEESLLQLARDYADEFDELNDYLHGRLRTWDLRDLLFS